MSPEDKLEDIVPLLSHPEILSDDIPDDPPDGKQSIHDGNSIGYYREFLKEDKWVLNTLENLHYIPFSSPPTDYFEKNNESANTEKQVLQYVKEIGFSPKMC